MTPDTAAPRLLAVNACGSQGPEGPFWIEFEVEPPADGLSLLTARRVLTERDALRDAADEVERLRDEVSALHAWHPQSAVGALRMIDAERERDASRTAHAALVADLRALHAPRTEVMSGSSDPKHVPMTRQVCSFCGDNYGSAPYPCATAALLDRHAPEEGR